MKSSLLMIASALFMGLLGLCATFIAHELLLAMGLAPEPFVVVTIQITGALYLGFAMQNWMAKGVLIGGIYSRPLALGNFLHFTVAAITLIKALPALNTLPFIGLTACYTVLAAWFGLVLFTHPDSVAKKKGAN